MAAEKSVESLIDDGDKKDDSGTTAAATLCEYYSMDSKRSTPRGPDEDNKVDKWYEEDDDPDVCGGSMLYSKYSDANVASAGTGAASSSGEQVLVAANVGYNRKVLHS